MRLRVMLSSNLVHVNTNMYKLSNQLHDYRISSRTSFKDRFLETESTRNGIGIKRNKEKCLTAIGHKGTIQKHRL